MITLDHIYALAGLFFAALSFLSARDSTNPKRRRNTAFWGLLALSFLFGSRLGDFNNGLLALGLVAIGGFGLGKGEPRTTSAAERLASAEKRGDALFLPALIIPAFTLFGALVLSKVELNGVLLLQARQATLISLALGAALATLIAMLWLRPPPIAPLQEARRLMDTVGWAAILPQMLASLGAVFALSGVGDAVGQLVAQLIPVSIPFAVVVAYCVGMALFTIIMGNAFAAFPVMTAAIGLPLIVGEFDGNPAIMGAVGMLAGFCGTLMTPMAANFNLVPAALLNLDRDAVIRAQIGTAIPLLIANTLLMYFLVFRF